MAKSITPNTRLYASFASGSSQCAPEAFSTAISAFQPPFVTANELTRKTSPGPCSG